MAQTAGDKKRKKRERQGTQKGKRLSVSLAREANIRIFHYLTYHGEKIRLETLVSKRQGTLWPLQQHARVTAEVWGTLTSSRFF